MLRKLFSAAAIVLAASGAGAATVDQSNLTTGNSAALTIDSNTIARAQSFTVGMSGFLTGVRTRLSDPTAADGLTLDVGIFGVSGGNIVTAGGPLLSATTTPSIDSASLFDYDIVETTFASSLAVSIGDTLAIVLGGVSAPQNQGFFWAQGGSYSGGSRWQDTGSGLVEVTTQDHEFETLVSTTPTAVPVPASLTLLLAGLGVFGILRRRPN